MNKLFPLIAAVLLFVSCGDNHRELFSATDQFIDAVIEAYENGTSANGKQGVYVEDEKYFVSCIGKLVVIDLDNFPNYYAEEFLPVVKEKYKEDKRVEDVIINRRGGITIQCRVDLSRFSGESEE